MICKKTSHNNGFTLIELAVVIIIIGVLAAGLLVSLKPIMFQSRLTATEANMNRIIDVIAGYAHRNNRVPCPANPNQGALGAPFGAEFGSGAAGANVGDCDNPGGGDLVEGIVPFRTLGMDIQDVQDGWGNFITYRISPVFAQDTTTALDAHERCRIDGLWIDGPASRAPEKARFCCPATNVLNAATDLRINDPAGNTLWPFGRDAAAGNYGNVNNSVPAGTFNPTTENVTQIAIVLVSHGNNADGAFMATGARIPDSDGAPDLEDENNNGDNIFISSPINLQEGAANYFDDIVMWRTQDQLYSETGVGSCAFP